MRESVGLEYTLAEDGLSYIVTGIGACGDDEVVIPSTYDGKPVTEIGLHAFKECKNIKHVTISDGLIRIGYGAFYGCSNLVSIDIPDSVEVIYRFAFGNCTSLASIEIPPNATIRHGYTFRGCESLTSIKIPDGVTDIGGYTFDGCTNLTTVVIPESVTNIHGNAFDDCESLTIVCYEGTKEQWENIEVEYNNRSLKRARTYYNYKSTYHDGLLLKLSEDENSYYVARLVDGTKTDVVIPSEYNGKPVAAINVRAFSKCSNLTSVTMPSSIKCIHRNAFEYCSSLTNVTLPERLTGIQYRVFFRCTSLENITIPSGVRGIVRWAFAGCNNLKTITIPSSVTFIDMHVFEACDSLTNVYYEGTEDDWKKISIGHSNGRLTNAHIICSDTDDDIFDFDDDEDNDLNESDSVGYEMVRSWKDEIERLKQPITVAEYTDSIIENPVTIAKMQLQDNDLEIAFSQKVNSVWIEIFHKVYSDVCDELGKLSEEPFVEIVEDLLAILKSLRIEEHGISIEVNDKALAHPNIEIIIKQVITAIQRILENIPKFYDAVRKEQTARERAAKIEELEAKIQQALTIKTVKIKSINDMLDDMLLGSKKSLTIDDLDLSARTYNCLKRAGILTVADLTEKTVEDLLKIRNVSRKGTCEEIIAKLGALGLSLKPSPDDDDIPIADDDKTAIMSLTVGELYHDFNLSVRAYNCLKRAGVLTVADLTNMTEYDLLKVRSMSRKSLDEIMAVLASLGLSLKSEE